ncbi:MAG: outer membrane beta-barrel protein [Steroidobacterales bacterium]
MPRKALILLALTSVAAAGLPAGAALAGDTGLYIGGAIGRSDERFDPSAYSVSADNVGYQVAAGWRPFGLLAGEVDYVGFGRASGGVNYADTYGVGVSALAFLPIPLVDVYGRVGLMNWRTNVSSPFGGYHRTGTNLAYGVGAGMHWGSLGARLEYERYDISATSTMSLASLGMTWTFM